MAAAPASSPRRILVPVDDSEADRRALDWTLHNLYRPGDVVHLLRVAPPGRFTVVSTGMPGNDLVEEEESMEAMEKMAREQVVGRFVSELEKREVAYEVSIVKFTTDSDSIGSVVCDYAERLRPVAVVLARHNKGPIKEFFVGSVTKYCLQHCSFPVLVMHCD